MELRVDRDMFTDNSTGGKLARLMRCVGGEWALPGNFQCYTLEPPTRRDDVKPRAIPPGRYRLTLRWSPKHGRMIPHVEDVPGFTAIEIHILNFPSETEGCTGVGNGRQKDAITGSHGAFDALFGMMAQECGLTDYLKYTDKIYEVGFITYAEPPTGLEGAV